MSVFGMHQCLPSALALSLSRWVPDWPAARRNVAQHKYLLRKGSLPSNRVNVNDAVPRGLLAVVLLLCGCTAAPVAVPRQLPVVADAQRSPLPAPGAPGAQDFFRGFRDPFPPATLYNPLGEKRVGLQAGHWKND